MEKTRPSYSRLHAEFDPELEWELIHGDKVICCTNLSDLLKDALYYSEHLSPSGVNELYVGLAALNLPDGLISNLRRRELLQRYKNRETPMEIDESPKWICK